MAKGVHRKQRSEAGLVTEIVLELASCQFRARIRLGGDETGFLAILDVVTHERVGDAAEVGSAAEAGDHDVGILPGELHLFLSLETYDGLVETDMVEHRTESVLAVGSGHSQLYRL